MGNENKIIKDRIISGFNLSIGTGLSMESIFNPVMEVYDPSRKVPDKIQINKYDEVWINIQTLYRNLLASMTKETISRTNSLILAHTIVNEMEIVNELFNKESNNIVKVYYYSRDYSELNKYPEKIRHMMSSTQSLAYKDMIKVLEIINKLVENINKNIYSNNKKGLIFTHNSFDLLSYDKFNRLDLLESNTGLLKTRMNFNSKFYKIPNMSLNNIPFNKKTLYCFGDKNFIMPLRLMVRKLLLDVSERRNWNPMTTIDKINADISYIITDKEILKEIGSF